MRVGKILELIGLGSSSRTYRLWTGGGTLSFEGQDYNGLYSDIGAFISSGKIRYSLNETAKSLRVEIVSDNITFRDDLSFGAALSQGRIGLICNKGSAWERCPVIFRGLISNISFEGELIKFNLDSGDIDKDRIRPKIWSHQSQLREFPNDQGFRFLPILVRGVRKKFLEPIGERDDD